MRIIRNKLLVDLKNESNEYLLVNILFGLVDVITKNEALLIKKWDNNNELTIPENDDERAFFQALVQRKYIMDANAENNIRQNIITSLKKHPQQLLTDSKSASFIFSYNCNFACPYCYEKSRTYNNDIMSIDMIDKVFSLYSKGLQHIGLFGGEPLLPENQLLIEYIIKKAPSAFYTVITNGYYLDMYLDLFKKIKIAMIQITLDGDKDAHNKTRKLKDGTPTFDKILENIDLCIASNLPLKIRMNISEQNKESCFNLRKKLKEKFGTKYLNFEMQPLFNYSYEKQATFYKDMLKNDKDTGAKNVIFHTLPRLSNFLFNHSPLSPMIRFCESESQNRFYDCYGDIYSCILSVGEKNKKIGSFYPQLKLKENSLLSYDITANPQCIECNLALLCGGGCPYYTMDNEGKIQKANCANIKNEIDNIIPILYKERFEKQ